MLSILKFSFFDKILIAFNDVMHFLIISGHFVVKFKIIYLRNIFLNMIIKHTH